MREEELYIIVNSAASGNGKLPDSALNFIARVVGQRMSWFDRLIGVRPGSIKAIFALNNVMFALHVSGRVSYHEVTIE